MKNWKTTLLGILGAGVVLATAKGWIDKEIAAFVGSAIVALFGIATQDATSRLVGTRPNDRKV